jgi:DNA (cytosine-5)-methyltransferase 1
VTAPTVIDLFCGAGGLSLGLTAAGMRIAGAFEMDARAVATYSKNLGAHVFEVDVRDLDARAVRRLAGLRRGEPTVLAGGPPCQGFSVQRRGDGDDPRNALVLDFLRLVDELAPAIFVMENVPALQKRAEFADFTARVDELGYVLHASVLDAADFGVPQRRRRLVAVGERRSRRMGFSFPGRVDQRRTVRDAIGDLPSPIDNGEEARLIANHELGNVSALNRQRISFVPEGGGRADIPEELRLPCHRVSVEKAGHRGVYGRLSWDAPAGTITTKCNSFTRGRFAHPSEDRNITMREAARLQGFPDEFVFLGSRVDVAHQIGNAVPPPLALAIGEAIVRALELRRR